MSRTHCTMQQVRVRLMRSLRNFADQNSQTGDIILSEISNTTYEGKAFFVCRPCANRQGRVCQSAANNLDYHVAN